MSDGLGQGYSEYKEGGAHPTIAANVLDPNVSADAQKGGRGVGGTNEATIKDEAQEHIQQHNQGVNDERYGSGHGLGSSTGQGLGSGTGHGLGSSTGHGLASGTSQYSSGQPNAGEPGFDQQHASGIDYLKGRSAAGHTGSTGTTSTGGVRGNDTLGSTGSQQYGSGATSGSQQYGTGSTSTGGYGRDSAAGGAATGGIIDPSRDPATNTTDRANMPTDSNVRTGGDPTTSADPTTADTAQGQHAGARDEAGAQSGGQHFHDPRAPTIQEAAAESDGHGGPPPNIPTAGGERIGTKHWGESKVIPDNPPKRPEEAADDATKANTAKNAAGSEEHHKEGLLEKVKGALHKK